MKALERRAARLASAAGKEHRRQLADELRLLLPGTQVEEHGSTIQLTGAGLRQRWLDDPAVRFAARVGP